VKFPSIPWISKLNSKIKILKIKKCHPTWLLSNVKLSH
jgi:hypothetical protein